MPLPLLNGEVVDREAEFQPLRDQIEELQADLRKMRQERDKARAEGMAAVSAVNALRDQLSGLYKAMRAIFGEIELVPEAEPQANPSLGRQEPQAGSHAAAAWDAWKSRLGSPCAKIISALQVHRAMTQTQISIATQINKKNIPTYIFRINKAGLLNKNGNEYSLKEL
jgi:hypothetical protein